MDAAITMLTEVSPWAAVIAALVIGYHQYHRSRNSQAIDMAQRAFERIKQVEDRLDRKDEEIAYLRCVIQWTMDHIGYLNSFWTRRGQYPPPPRYEAPPPPEKRLQQGEGRRNLN